MNHLKEKTPFALSRMNDGEMLGIAQPGTVVSRGYQKVDVSLCFKLTQALTHQQENYYVGLPCGTCYPEHLKVAEELIDKDYKFFTHAVVFVNRNWKRFTEEFPKHVEGRTVYWVGGDNQDIKGLPFEVAEQYKVPAHNAWTSYSEVKGLIENFEEGAVVLVTGGPLSRVLVKEWFEKRPDLTIIDIGSNFDPITKNVWYNYQKGWEETGFNLTARCKECN